MATKKYDIAVVVSTYQSGNETKRRYQNIGAVFQGENGPYLILNRSFNPAGVPFKEGSDSIICSLFEPKDKAGGPAQAPGRAPAPAPAGAGARKPADKEDDIPF